MLQRARRGRGKGGTGGGSPHERREAQHASRRRRRRRARPAAAVVAPAPLPVHRRCGAAPCRSTVERERHRREELGVVIVATPCVPVGAVGQPRVVAPLRASHGAPTQLSTATVLFAVRDLERHLLVPPALGEGLRPLHQRELLQVWKPVHAAERDTRAHPQLAPRRLGAQLVELLGCRAKRHQRLRRLEMRHDDQYNLDRERVQTRVLLGWRTPHRLPGTWRSDEGGAAPEHPAV